MIGSENIVCINWKTHKLQNVNNAGVKKSENLYLQTHFSKKYNDFKQNLTLADQYTLKLNMEQLTGVKQSSYHNDVRTLRINDHNILILFLDNHMFVIKTDIGAQYRNVLTNQRIARHIVVQGK